MPYEDASAPYKVLWRFIVLELLPHVGVPWSERVEKLGVLTLQEEDFLSFVTESDLAFVFTMFEYAMMYWTTREEQEVNDQMIVSQVPEFTETQTVGVTTFAL